MKTPAQLYEAANTASAEAIRLRRRGAGALAYLQTLNAKAFRALARHHLETHAHGA